MKYTIEQIKYEISRTKELRVSEFAKNGEDASLVLDILANSENNVTSLMILDCDMSSELTVQAMVKALKINTTVKKLRLRNLMPEDLPSIAEMLEQNRGIVEFRLDLTGVTDHGLQALTDAVIKNHNITKICLNFDKREFANIKQVQILSEIIKKQGIKEFYLQGTNTTKEAKKILFGAWIENPDLDFVFYFLNHEDRNDSDSYKTSYEDFFVPAKEECDLKKMCNILKVIQKIYIIYGKGEPVTKFLKMDEMLKDFEETFAMFEIENIKDSRDTAIKIIKISEAIKDIKETLVFITSVRGNTKYKGKAIKILEVHEFTEDWIEQLVDKLYNNGRKDIYLRVAMELYKDGELKKALKFFKKVHLEDVNSPEDAFAVSNIYFVQGDYKKALECIGKIDTPDAIGLKCFIITNLINSRLGNRLIVDKILNDSDIINALTEETDKLKLEKVTIAQNLVQKGANPQILIDIFGQIFMEELLSKDNDMNLDDKNLSLDDEVLENHSFNKINAFDEINNLISIINTLEKEKIKIITDIIKEKVISAETLAGIINQFTLTQEETAKRMEEKGMLFVLNEKSSDVLINSKFLIEALSQEAGTTIYPDGTIITPDGEMSTLGATE